MVDAICYAHYGYVDGALEAVYKANPHIRDLPARLPMGTKLALPALTAPSASRLTRLWDKE